MVLVGCLALAGWILDSEPLKALVRGGVAMNPATALCFVLCGFSLWCHGPRSTRELQCAGLLAASLVAILALLRLGSYALEN